MTRFFSFLFAFLFTVTLYSQNILYVKPSSSSTAWSQKPLEFVYNNVQSAIDNSASGDEVWVAAGIYYPTKGINNNTERFLSFIMKNGVSLHGGFAGTENNLNERNRIGELAWNYANPTIFSGNYNDNNDSTDNVYHVVWFGTETLSDTTLLEGVTIQHGYADGATANDQKGAGVFLAKKGVLQNCVIQHNVALNGGGIFCYDNAKIDNCFIFNNKTWLNNGIGGGLHCNSKTQYIANSLFQMNWAARDGGAIYGGLNTEIINSNFIDNRCEQNGGAIYALAGQKCNNLYFWNNSAEINGGAYYANYGNNSINATVFQANQANNDGGAIFFANNTSGHKITNSLFTNNEAETGGAINSQSELLIVNSTIVRNKALIAGGIAGTTTDKLYNTIVWGNAATTFSQILGEITANYSAVEGELLQGDGNIHLPENSNDSISFLNPTHIIGYPQSEENELIIKQAVYEISSLSVCYNTGTSTVPSYQFATEDIIGNPRMNGLPDMGAYELWCIEEPTLLTQIIEIDTNRANIELLIQNYNSNLTYEVNFGDNSEMEILTSSTATHTYHTEGVFTITVVTKDEKEQCVQQTETTIEIQFMPVAIFDTEIICKFYPNPVQEKLFIEVTEGATIVHIYDEIGKKIETFQINDNIHIIDTKMWKTGFYSAVLYNKKGTKTVKIVKL